MDRDLKKNKLPNLTVKDLRDNPIKNTR